MKNLNRQGFTAIELMIGMGLATLLTGIVISTQFMVTSDQMKLTRSLEDSIDTKLAERILFSDFNNVDPSYNNLATLDDSNLPFFDYYPDLPGNSINGKLDRNVSLKPSGRKEIVIMTQDLSAGGLLIYDPVLAYKVGAAPEDFNQAASLSFQGLNFGNKVTQQRPVLWTEGRTVMLDTPARLRPVDANGNLNMQIPPRSPIYVGTISGATTTQNSDIKNLIRTAHPETNEPIDTADIFLRKAPSIGGGQSLIRLRAVNLIKYSLEEVKDTRSNRMMGNLYKSTYKNGKWGLPVLLADRVEELHLRRDSVLKRMIYFKVKKLVDEKKPQTAGL